MKLYFFSRLLSVVETGEASTVGRCHHGDDQCSCFLERPLFYYSPKILV